MFSARPSRKTRLNSFKCFHHCGGGVRLPFFTLAIFCFQSVGCLVVFGRFLTGNKKCHTVRKNTQDKNGHDYLITLATDQDAALAYLTEARKHHTQAAIAKHLGVGIRTISRWEARQTNPPAYLAHALQQLLPFGKKTPQAHSIS